MCAKVFSELEKTEAYKSLDASLQAEIVACNKREKEAGTTVTYK